METKKANVEEDTEVWNEKHSSLEKL
jgi:hypothetical protein